MKKLVTLLVVLALELSVCACGSSPNTSTVNNTSTTGNWEAQLTGGTAQASLLNFVVTFSVTNSGPLNITGVGFFNQSSCFATGLNVTTESGTASFTTDNAGQVTGTLSLNIKSNANGSALALTGQLTGTSNGTTTTVGNLTNGVVVGTWTLTPGSSATSCNAGSGNFVMCQGTATCSTTPALVERL
jgi:hypothetical protein